MSSAARIRWTEDKRSASQLSNVELMKACASASAQDAWDEFVRRFNRFVCLSVVRAVSQCSGRPTRQLDPETVSDLVQDVYVKLLERSRDRNYSFRGENDAAVFVYIGRVAISIVVDAQRRSYARKRSREVLSLDAVVSRGSDTEFTLAETIRSTAPTPEQDAIAAILRTEVTAALAVVVTGRNASRDLMIAEAYILDGVPANEIAKSIGSMSTCAVKTSVWRTGARLRKEFSRRKRISSHRRAQPS